MTRQSANYPLDYSKSADADRLRDIADKATDQFKGAADSAQEIAGKVTEQVREYADKAQDAVKGFKPLVEKSLKNQPMATLAGAAIIGFILGALWRK